MKTFARNIYRNLTHSNVGESGKIESPVVDDSKVNKLDLHKTNRRLISSLRAMYETDVAMKLAVGGEFEAVGFLELEILKYCGLAKDSYVIDVGCGSGRLAKPLSQFLSGRYLGIDIVPELLEYARKITGRSDWRFEVTDGLTIGERDESADLICFFSVFTHMLHEQSFVYLEEAKRVLKPGGKIVFSFLDFEVPMHWEVFATNVQDLNTKAYPLNMFISKGGIEAWASHLNLTIETIQDGDKYFIPLSKPVKFENFEKGAAMDTLGRLWQSVCVLRK